MRIFHALAHLIGSPTKSTKRESAGAYYVNGRLIVFTFETTRQGVILQARPVPLQTPVFRSDFVAALAGSLSALGNVVPHPAREEWAGTFAPFLRAAGVRSRKAFMQTAKLVDLVRTSDGYEVQLWKNLGAKGGFEPEGETTHIAGLDLTTLADTLAHKLGIDLIS